jgi:hypothetical protein
MALLYSGPILPYTQAVIDQSRLWVPVITMNQALQNLTNISPSTHAGRQTIIDTVATLTGAAPYAIADGQTILTDLRFSTQTNAGNPKTVYTSIATFRDGWSEVITQLLSAADFAQRTNEKGINDGTPGVEVPNADNMRSQQNDALLSVRKAVQTARMLLSNSTGCYNYHTFEAKYQLVWSAATEPPPFKGFDHAFAADSLSNKASKLSLVHQPDPSPLASIDSVLAIAIRLTDDKHRASFIAAVLPNHVASPRVGELLALYASKCEDSSPIPPK